MLAKVSFQKSQVDSLAFHPFPISSAPASRTSLVGLLDPSSTTSVGLDSSFQGAQKPPILQPVLVYSSASLADQHQEPIFNSGSASAISPVSCPQPVPQPVPPVLTQLPLPQHQCFRPTTSSPNCIDDIFTVPPSGALCWSFYHAIYSSQQLG